jgi:hypothetical protein
MNHSSLSFLNLPSLNAIKAQLREAEEKNKNLHHTINALQLKSEFDDRRIFEISSLNDKHMKEIEKLRDDNKDLRGENKDLRGENRGIRDFMNSSSKMFPLSATEKPSGRSSQKCATFSTNYFLSRLIENNTTKQSNERERSPKNQKRSYLAEDDTENSPTKQFSMLSKKTKRALDY